MLLQRWRTFIFQSSHSGSFFKSLEFEVFIEVHTTLQLFCLETKIINCQVHTVDKPTFFGEKFFSCFRVPLWLLSRFLRFLFHAKNFRARCFRFPWYVGKNVVCHIILEENQDPIFKRLSTSFEFGSNEKSMRNNSEMSIYNLTS